MKRKFLIFYVILIFLLTSFTLGWGEDSWNNLNDIQIKEIKTEFLNAKEDISSLLQSVIIRQVLDDYINSANVKQKGINNWILVKQSGMFNSVQINQFGDYNKAFASQKGDNNFILESQLGSNNYLSITQIGNYDQVWSFQYGSGLSYELKQTGNFKRLIIIQYRR
ncbi:MAG: hypothetical protein GXO57_02555 [Thermodesulfobacteria bacterium]|nr:hypothetical protein [Thermodesulfobacteriota bacterium]